MAIETSKLKWVDGHDQFMQEIIDQLNDSDVDPSIYHRLNDHAENHFKMEEEYMIKIDYPRIDEHIQAHDQFRSELNSMMQSSQSFDKAFRQSLSRFLGEWFKIHITETDKQLKDFILKSNIH